MAARPVLVSADSDEDFETVEDAARRAGPPHPIARASFCHSHGVSACHIKPVDHARQLQVLQHRFFHWLGSVALPARTSPDQ